MIALDTNILVYAHREDSPWHEAASAHVAELAEGRAAWAIPWPCLQEFLAIVTHPRIYQPPTPLPRAVVLLAESAGYWNILGATLTAGQVTGPQVHDARVAALCRHHGVRELWSADRDFSRFPELSVRNPLVG